MRKRKQKCLMTGCSKTNIVACGLCSGCYQVAIRLVKAKKTTWDKLEKRGLCKRGRRGNPGGRTYQLILGTK